MENRKRLPLQQPLKHNINIVPTEDKKQKKQLKITRKTNVIETKLNEPLVEKINVEIENEHDETKESIKQLSTNPKSKFVSKQKIKPSFNLVTHCNGPTCVRPNKPNKPNTINTQDTENTENTENTQCNQEQCESLNENNEITCDSNENEETEPDHGDVCVCGECTDEI